MAVAELYIYPIKSCKGISVRKAWIDVHGFELDRMWMVVGEDGKFLTQRDHPKMILIDVRVEADLELPGAYKRGGRLVVSAPGMDRDVCVEFRRSFEDVESEKYMVWKHSVDGIDEGDEVGEWFSRFLGVKARLIVKAILFFFS
ncbi:Mitochondrial amidoxime reducing component 2 [Dinochytrium kinnereticum]|nr:Mitochondrial amidoxime reducing component 2 [Dinochytrium kinnereticum]